MQQEFFGEEGTMDDEKPKRPSKPPKTVRDPQEWKAFRTSTSNCNCGKFDLKDLPHVERLLPENYEYKLCDYEPLGNEEKFLVTLRMKFTTKDEALVWKRCFEEKSLSTHSILQLYPKVSLKRVFKGMYKCKFNQRWRDKRPRKRCSQFEVTDCPSSLNIVIKNFVKQGRTRSSDPHLPDYPTLIRIRFAHNHDITGPKSLQKRPLCPDIAKRFEEMFRQGMKPKDALDKHKRDLQQQLGMANYLSVAVDGFYVPDKNKVYRLYTKVMGKTSAKTTTKRVSKHNPDADMIAFNYCTSSDKEVGKEPNNDDGKEEHNQMMDNEDVDVDESEMLSEMDDIAGGDGTDVNVSLCESGLVSSTPNQNPATEAEKQMDSSVARDLQVFDALISEPGPANHNLAQPSSAPPPLSLPSQPSHAINSANSDLNQSIVGMNFGGVPQPPLSSLSTPFSQSPSGSTVQSVTGALVQNMPTPPVLTLQNMGAHSFDYQNLQVRQQSQLQTLSASTANFSQLTSQPLLPNLQVAPSSCALQQIPAPMQVSNHQNFATNHYNVVSNLGFPQPSHQALMSQSMLNQTQLLQTAFQPHQPQLQQHQQQQHQPVRQQPPPRQHHQQQTQEQPQQSLTSPMQYQPTHLNHQAAASAENENEQAQTQAWLSHKGAIIHCQPPSLLRKPTGGKVAAQRKRYQNISNLKTVSQKKIDSIRSEFRANSFRKTLVKKAPKVDLVTHNTAFQAVQNMLLIDESKRLNERFAQFCSDLAEKMTSNPKLFVPGVRNLMNTWQDLKVDEDRAAALADFGKLEQKVIEDQKKKRLENMRDKGIQALRKKIQHEPTLLCPVEKTHPGDKVFLLPISKVNLKKTTVARSVVGTNTSDCLVLKKDSTTSPLLCESLVFQNGTSSSNESECSLRSKLADKVRKRLMNHTDDSVLERLKSPPKSLAEVQKNLEGKAKAGSKNSETKTRSRKRNGSTLKVLISGNKRAKGQKNSKKMETDTEEHDISTSSKDTRSQRVRNKVRGKRKTTAKKVKTEDVIESELSSQENDRTS